MFNTAQVRTKTSLTNMLPTNVNRLAWQTFSEDNSRFIMTMLCCLYKMDVILKLYIMHRRIRAGELSNAEIDNLMTIMANHRLVFEKKERLQGQQVLTGYIKCS